MIGKGKQDECNKHRGTQQNADSEHQLDFVVAGEEGEDRDEEHQVAQQEVTVVEPPGDGLSDLRWRIEVVEINLGLQDHQEGHRQQRQNGTLDLNERVDSFHSPEQLLHQLHANIQDEADEAAKDTNSDNHQIYIVLQDVRRD